MSAASYFNTVNPGLLSLIPPDAKVVLEIGCGAGALCKAYRRVNPGVTWTGVEPNEEAAEQAKRVCTKVYNYPIESIPMHWLAAPDDMMPDCIIFGDVLEHLSDPWEQLKRIAFHAKPGAQVLACIPNVQHWTIIRDLLAGHWRYRDEGLLDRTHLRFFTLESIKSMFADAGLQIFEIRGRDIGNEGFEAFAKSLDGLASKEMKAFQFLVRALKPR